eukprot:3156924-Pleurochrysis_carterae.AAC.1
MCAPACARVRMHKCARTSARVKMRARDCTSAHVDARARASTRAGGTRAGQQLRERPRLCVPCKRVRARACA